MWSVYLLWGFQWGSFSGLLLLPPLLAHYYNLSSPPHSCVWPLTSTTLWVPLNTIIWLAHHKIAKTSLNLEQPTIYGPGLILTDILHKLSSQLALCLYGNLPTLFRSLLGAVISQGQAGGRWERLSSALRAFLGTNKEFISISMSSANKRHFHQIELTNRYLQDLGITSEGLWRKKWG